MKQPMAETIIEAHNDVTKKLSQTETVNKKYRQMQIKELFLLCSIVLLLPFFNANVCAQDEIKPPNVLKMKLVEKRMIKFRSLDGTGNCYISEDGSNEYFPKTSITGLRKDIQYSFTLLPDKKSWMLTAMENVDGWVEGKTVMRFWKYDLSTGKRIKELLSENRPANHISIVGFLNDGKRILCQVATNNPKEGKRQPTYIVDVETDEWKRLTGEKEFIYGVKANHTETRIAFHKAESVYSINTIDMEGQDRKTLVRKRGHVHFAPVWSPDDKWLAYLDCYSKKDPAHYFADLCLGKPDGSEHRIVTNGQSQYFGTAHGPKENRGGGSNTTLWTKDGKYLLYTKRSPGAHPDATYRAELGDHKEHVFCPECAKGGTSLFLLDPFTGEEIPITKFEEGKWDFEGSFSPDGKKLVYVTAKVGCRAEIRICDIDGKNDKFLTAGNNELGADYPTWVESILVEENSPLNQ